MALGWGLRDADVIPWDSPIGGAGDARGDSQEERHREAELRVTLAAPPYDVPALSGNGGIWTFSCMYRASRAGAADGVRVSKAGGNEFWGRQEVAMQIAGFQRSSHPLLGALAVWLRDCQQAIAREQARE